MEEGGQGVLEGSKRWKNVTRTWKRMGVATFEEMNKGLERIESEKQIRQNREERMK